MTRATLSLTLRMAPMLCMPLSGEPSISFRGRSPWAEIHIWGGGAGGAEPEGSV